MDTYFADKWLKRVGIDYFTEFIKAYIPFNAYMNTSFYEDSDRKMLQRVKTESNPIKSKIESLIDGDSAEAKAFRSNLGFLHYQLENYVIMNEDQKVSFSNIATTNRNIKVDEPKNSIQYYVKRDKNSGTVEIKLTSLSSSGRVLLDLNQDKYNQTELEDNNDYKRLSDTQKRVLIEFYKSINPVTVKNLLILDNPTSFYDFGNYHFNNNREIVVSGIIEILYRLRCSLFHGITEPTDDNNTTYKYAYEILYTIIQSLR